MQNIDVRLDGVAYLNDVSLDFKRGGLYTVLGRTLAGKTTLLRTIAGLQDPQKGTLTLHGQNYLRLPVWKRNVAMVYQQFINYPHLNVLDNVAFPLQRAGLPCKEARRRAGEVLSKMGLANFESAVLHPCQAGNSSEWLWPELLSNERKFCCSMSLL